ncbi:hypothetical protein Tco_1475853 [Tanacetum coccineum]
MTNRQIALNIISISSDCSEMIIPKADCPPSLSHSPSYEFLMKFLAVEDCQYTASEHSIINILKDELDLLHPHENKVDGRVDSLDTSFLSGNGVLDVERHE